MQRNQRRRSLIADIMISLRSKAFINVGSSTHVLQLIKTSIYTVFTQRTRISVHLCMCICAICVRTFKMKIPLVYIKFKWEIKCTPSKEKAEPEKQGFLEVPGSCQMSEDVSLYIKIMFFSFTFARLRASKTTLDLLYKTSKSPRLQHILFA